MKRTLYIVRHAKAEDAAPFFGDFERELTTSGTIDAARMGKFLAEKQVKADYMVSSSAPRAYQTAKVMAEQMGFEIEKIKTTRDMYDNGPKAYLQALSNIPDDVEVAMIFGHNPDITYFAEYLTNQMIDSMAKGSVCVVQFDALPWAAISARTGTFLSYDAPKQFR